jgi:hypothetical protein
VAPFLILNVCPTVGRLVAAHWALQTEEGPMEKPV